MASKFFPILGAHRPFSGGTHPPRARRLLDSYQSQEGAGIGLYAAITSSPPPVVATKTQSFVIDADLQQVVDQMAALTSGERIATACAPFALEMGFVPGSGTFKVIMPSIGESSELRAPTSVELDQLAARVERELAEGKSWLPQVCAEAEHPEWAFMPALEMLRSKPVEFDLTLDLMDVVCYVVAVPVFASKNHLDVRRPSEVRTFQPWIPVPQHRSLPSGHAAAAYALAKVLSKLTGAAYADLENVAWAVAKRRELAGVHTERDSEQGAELGKKLGDWMLDFVDSPGKLFKAWAALFKAAAREW